MCQKLATCCITAGVNVIAGATATYALLRFILQFYSSFNAYTSLILHCLKCVAPSLFSSAALSVEALLVYFEHLDSHQPL